MFVRNGPDFVGRIDGKNSIRYNSLWRRGLRVPEFCRGTTSSLPLEAMLARITIGYCKRTPTVVWLSAWGNDEAAPSGSDLGGFLADLLEGARRRNLSANSLAAYERTGGRSSRGQRPRAWIHALFLFLPPWRGIGF